ncbi:MAG TPA: hypothetical protein VFP12_15060 [Allosphingosinicella sp.]|nr:hypothetical protein [Allosphingosinicella sp.]
MRILGLIAATSALLAACGERRDDPPAAAPANQSDAPANQSAAPVSQSDAPVNKSDAPAAEAGGNSAAASVPAASTSASPCLVQDGKPVAAPALRAIGTEPFWGADIQGRCVTYSHPEDQKGTRIWTRFTPGPGGGTWSGSLGGRRFELRIRPEAGCSDGMSDRRYPLAAELLVGGERRTGCAAPA